MKKLLLGILCLIMLAMPLSILGGCSDPFGPDDSKENKEKINLKVAVLNSDAERATMSALKTAYEAKNPDINIVIQGLTADYESSVINFIKSPNLFPDVLWVPGEHHSTFSSQGHFLNLRGRMESDPDIDLNDFYESIIDITHYNNEDDGIWFAPRDYNKPVVLINRKMFQLAGIPIPSNDWDMDDFFDVCAKLRAKMDDESNTMEERNEGLMPAAYPVDSDLAWNPSYFSFINHYGGKLIDTSRTGADAITIDTEYSKEAYKSIYRDFIKTKYSPSNDTSNLFTRKYSAMWVTVRPELQAAVNLGIDVDFLPMPTERAVVGCSGYAIPTVAEERLDTKLGNTKNNAELAWDFIKFVLSVEGQNVLGRTGTGVPVLKSMAQTGDWRNYISADRNHDAFLAYPERDLSQMDHYIFPPQYHIYIMRQFNILANSITSPQTWAGSQLGGVTSGGNWNNLNNAVEDVKKELLKYV